MAVNKGITRKISQKLSTIDPSLPESKVFTKKNLLVPSLWPGSENSKAAASSRTESAGAVSTGQEKYN
jgi:hypothetical protein